MKKITYISLHNDDNEYFTKMQKSCNHYIINRYLQALCLSSEFRATKNFQRENCSLKYNEVFCNVVLRLDE